MTLLQCDGAGGRGCPCAYHRARRAYTRAYAQRARDRRDAERNRGATTCQHRHGGGVCGTILDTIVDSLGRTALVCRMCERRKRGVCRDCPRPVHGRIGSAVRCLQHRELARREQMRDCERRNAEEHRVMARRRGRQLKATNDPRYLAKLEYKRAYRKAHRDKMAAYKRRSYEKNREKILAYHAAYRATQGRGRRVDLQAGAA